MPKFGHFFVRRIILAVLKATPNTSALVSGILDAHKNISHNIINMYFI